MKLFLATGNKHKIEEIKAIFHENEVEIFSILDGISIPEVVEDGKTFEENSQKGRIFDGGIRSFNNTYRKKLIYLCRRDGYTIHRNVCRARIARQSCVKEQIL